MYFLKELSDFKVPNVKNINNAFKGYKLLESINLLFEFIKTMVSAFSDCESLKALFKIDFSKVEFAIFTFENCKSLVLDENYELNFLSLINGYEMFLERTSLGCISKIYVLSSNIGKYLKILI